LFDELAQFSLHKFSAACNPPGTSERLNADAILADEIFRLLHEGRQAGWLDGLAGKSGLAVCDGVFEAAHGATRCQGRGECAPEICRRQFPLLPADGLSRHRHAGGKFLDKDFQKKVIAIQPGQAQFRHRNHSIRRKGTFGKASVVSA
jgi:hypothetical protein